MTEAPTIQERYGKAINSSHLEVSTIQRGDVDVLIAAGFVHSRMMGVQLYRLAAEYDSVRAEMRTTANNSATEQLLILMRVKSLSATKQALVEWAMMEAVKRKFMDPGVMPLPLPDMKVWRERLNQRDKITAELAGRALRAFLDPHCPKCTGRGFSGGYGSPQIACKPCKGSGKTRESISKIPTEVRFGFHLVDEMERMTTAVEGLMRRYLSEKATQENGACISK